ncbi:MAG: low molecular weight protein-tyrosine-phosphatase [Bacteroidota bacterium]|jgi:protein-tyrosine phosphatase|nr:low molecular weight phosphotyrosine protein phosphatase [Sphingobacteriales bacterium]
MIKVLFVCLGNICRSPLAEGIFRAIVEEEELDHSFFIDSAGTASYHIGSLPDERTRKVAEDRGIKLTHKARAFTTNDFYAFDFIITMDESNLSNVIRLMPEDNRARIHLLREFDSVGKGQAVPDPYYGDISDFEKVHDILDRSCMHLLDFIKANHLNTNR